MNKTIYKNKWIEITSGFGFEIKYNVAGYFDTRPNICFCFIWGRFYIFLPFNTGISECELPCYGFYWYESALWINVGKETHAFDAPWSWDWYRTSYLLKDSWISERKGQRINLKPWSEPLKSQIWSIKYPYKYVLKSGDVQECIASISIEEREWRRKFLMWTPIFNKVSRDIAVSFNKEVGEESGSWKGGCVGCGYEMRRISFNKYEEPLTCLMRMENERKF